MADSNDDASPLAAAAAAVGPRATEAFSLLGDETRLAILLALWEAYEPFAGGTWDPTEGNTVSFSELRRHVGMRDPGQFRYHLEKLIGEFVERTPEGYQLLPAGNKLVRTVIGSAGFGETVLEPAEVDLPCPYCDAPTALTYRHQRVYHVCPDCDGAFQLGAKHPSGVLNAWVANPTILREQDHEAILAAVHTEFSRKFATQTGGVCHGCSGRVDGRLDVCEDHDAGDGEPCPACGREPELMAQFVCGTCKKSSQVDVTTLGFNHPAAVAFAWDHGVDLAYGPRDLETVRWVDAVREDAEEELVSTDPPRVQVTLRRGDESVGLTFDGALRVVEASRGG